MFHGKSRHTPESGNCLVTPQQQQGDPRHRACLFPFDQRTPALAVHQYLPMPSKQTMKTADELTSMISNISSGQIEAETIFHSAIFEFKKASRRTQTRLKDLGMLVNKMKTNPSGWKEVNRPKCTCGSGRRITRCNKRECNITATEMCFATKNKPMLKTKCKRIGCTHVPWSVYCMFGTCPNSCLQCVCNTNATDVDLFLQPDFRLYKHSSHS